MNLEIDPPISGNILMASTELIDISEYQIAFTGENNHGIAIDPEKNSMLLLSKSSAYESWNKTPYEVSDIRSVEISKVDPTKHFMVGGSGGARGIGEGLRLASLNKKERKNAAAQTGITVNLRSIETPTFFIQIQDDVLRSKAFEALSQICESGSVKGTLNTIPAVVAESMMSPNLPQSSETDDPALRFVPNRNQTDDPATRFIPKKTQDNSTGDTADAARKRKSGAIILVVLLVLVLLIGMLA